MLVLVAMILGAADGGVPAGISLSPSEVYARVSSSVFLVTTERALGSAVVVGPELLVTNFHVIDGAKSVRVSHGEAGWDAAIEKINVDRDLAVLRVPGLRRAAPRRRGLSALKVGERVYALGAPKGFEQTFSEGIVAALRPSVEKVLKGKKSQTPLQHTAPITNGSSGGGLFDDRGRLLGLNTISHHDGDLNFAVPADWIGDLMSAKDDGGRGVVGEVGPTLPSPAVFSALRRPRAVDCHLVRRLRYAPGLSGELSELIGEDPLDDHVFVVNFRDEVAEAREGSIFGGQQRDIVMSAIDNSSGIVQFAGARLGPPLTFIFGEEGSIGMLFQEVTRLRGQPRRLLTVGECEVFDLEGAKSARDAAIRKQESEFKAKAAEQVSNEESCDKGFPGACLVVAKEAVREGGEGSAALYFKKACLLDSREGCWSAFEMYTRVGNTRVAAEMQQRLCQLGGCAPGAPSTSGSTQR